MAYRRWRLERRAPQTRCGRAQDLRCLEPCAQPRRPIDALHPDLNARASRAEVRSVVDTTTASMSPGWTPGLVFRNVLAFAGNMLQVYGVTYWGWDMFQILMLYWMETGVIAF